MDIPVLRLPDDDDGMTAVASVHHSEAAAISPYHNTTGGLDGTREDTVSDAG
jgi:hypothetical protein